ncbi:MAG: GGDEF domain-containing protein, partial [Patescibacteria group bacterium]|nr:GGDEF domain-containing protein [Patescibacteria group bacterium]
MSFSWPIFAVMLLLGAVQLAVGVVLGRCLPVGGFRKPSHVEQGGRLAIDQRRLRFFAERLRRLLAGVSGDVDSHRQQISEVSRELAGVHDDDGGELTDSVLRSLARIMAINERLQGRLESAENRLQQQNEQLEAHFNESRTDALTGLMNRRAFDDALAFQAEQGSRPFAVMMLDVDHFKAMNDEYGHPAGDEVLCGISNRLEAVLAGRGMVARYGGEEFAAIIPAVDAEQAQRIAEQLRLAVAAAPFLHEKARLPMSMSLGVALVQDGDDVVAAMKRADEALYTAKRSGRNCGYFHDGATCQRIDADAGDLAQPSAGETVDMRSEMPPSRWVSPGLTDQDDFDDISVDLRQRMLE